MRDHDSRLYLLVPLSSPDRDGLLSSSISWSKSSVHPMGHPRLHQMLAYNLWNAQR